MECCRSNVAGRDSEVRLMEPFYLMYYDDSVNPHLDALQLLERWRLPSLCSNLVEQ